MRCLKSQNILRYAELNFCITLVTVFWKEFYIISPKEFSVRNHFWLENWQVRVKVKNPVEVVHLMLKLWNIIFLFNIHNTLSFVIIRMCGSIFQLNIYLFQLPAVMLLFDWQIGEVGWLQLHVFHLSKVGGYFTWRLLPASRTSSSLMFYWSDVILKSVVLCGDFLQLYQVRVVLFWYLFGLGAKWYTLFPPKNTPLVDCDIKTVKHSKWIPC